MDLMQKLGGRKFLMGVAVLGIATLLEIKGPQGLTQTMATFMGSLVGLFSMANYASTAKYLSAKTQAQAPAAEVDLSPVEAKLEQIQGVLSVGVANPDNLNTLLEILGKLKTDLEQVKATTGQIGVGVVNLAKRG